MLTEEIKGAARAATEPIAAARPNVRRRRSQNLLIAEIAKTCAGEYGGQQHLVAEAPPGTGKSVYPLHFGELGTSAQAPC